ncbi:MAG: SIS domain-containing protein [Bacteroidota bacterium]
MSHFANYIEKEIEIIKMLDVVALEKAARLILDAYHKGANIYICGNGGSGASASHITGDYIKGASYGLDKRFKFICLNDNITSILAISNDLSYEEIFIEPLKNFAQAGELFIGISGSGNSANIVKAMQYAKDSGLQTIALSGFKGGKIKDMADVCIYTPVNDMQITEDLHMMALHAIFQYIVKELFGKSTNEKTMGAAYDKRME